jgi:hypothetical protein
MSKTLTATELRANLYRVLDQVAADGKPRTVLRKGCEIVIQRKALRKKRLDLSKLTKRDVLLNCTFDELVATTWPYKPDPNV